MSKRKRTGKAKREPIHPGAVLKREYMDRHGITAYRLSRDIGTSAQHVGRVIHGQRGIGADMALRLARYFGMSAELWMNLQAKHDLDVTANRLGAEIERQVQPRDGA